MQHSSFVPAKYNPLSIITQLSTRVGQTKANIEHEIHLNSKLQTAYNTSHRKTNNPILGFIKILTHKSKFITKVSKQSQDNQHVFIRRDK